MRNAIEAMHGCERRELLIATSPVEHDMIEVSVADTGQGLSEEIAERLFQPFVTTKPAGMGVGLSISKRIIEAHGGKMWAEPNPGGGTVFRFTLQSAVEVG
jgi:two-component system sensor kinase FixL